MVDPLVSEFHSRDLDSVPSPREVEAVKEWLASKNKTFHIMRDHPYHRVPILGDIINTYYFCPELYYITIEFLKRISIFILHLYFH